MLEHTQSPIQSKEKAIREKTAEAAVKSQRKTELEADLVNMRQQIVEAERQRKSRKEDALVVTGLGLLGIIAGPITFGGSLVLTPGLGYATYKVGRMDDVEKEADACRQCVNILTAEIMQSDEVVAILQREKSELHKLVRQYQWEIPDRTSKQLTHKRQIEEADQAQEEITTLKSHAASTKAKLIQVFPEFQKLKVNVDQCRIMVKEKSLDVSTSTSSMERWTERLLVIGGNIIKSRELKKQKRLIEEASETLCRINSEIPGLLRSHEGKFLDIKPFGSGLVMGADGETPITDTYSTTACLASSGNLGRGLLSLFYRWQPRQ